MAPDMEVDPVSEPKRWHLVFLGFADEQVARGMSEFIKQAMRDKSIPVVDWAMVHKAPGGKVTVTQDRSNDPGALRGGMFGGGVGLILAVASGPIGAAAIVGGAAIGAVTAAVKDSGFDDKAIQTVSTLMADGRSGIMLVMPLEEQPAWDEFVAAHPEFGAADAKHEVDLVPGRSFEQAVEEYRSREEA